MGRTTKAGKLRIWKMREQLVEIGDGIWAGARAWMLGGRHVIVWARESVVGSRCAGLEARCEPSSMTAGDELEGARPWEAI